MSAAETISIILPTEQLRAVHESVEAGEYASISDVMRDAVWLWQRQQSAERLEIIRTRIRQSLDDPRPALSLEEVDTALEKLFVGAENDALQG